MLTSTARLRGSASLARDLWIAGRDVWPYGHAKQAVTVIMVCEAAAWLNDNRTFGDAFAAGSGFVNDATRARLEFLKEAYLSHPTLAVPRLLALPNLLPHNAVLRYVDYYARARAADSEDRFDVALEHYRHALDSLPKEHAAYDFALGRCNQIINMRSAK